MNYTIKAHPTHYDGILFRSRLEARWAAFFDRIAWHWKYEPIDFSGWTPDFWVKIHCRHNQGECFDHVIYAEVKPFEDVETFKQHPAYNLAYRYDNKEKLNVEAVGLLGLDPSVSLFSMVHGDGGGGYTIPSFAPYWEQSWKEAGNVVMYRNPYADEADYV